MTVKMDLTPSNAKDIGNDHDMLGDPFYEVYHLNANNYTVT